MKSITNNEHHSPPAGLASNSDQGDGWDDWVYKIVFEQCSVSTSTKRLLVKRKHQQSPLSTCVLKNDFETLFSAR